MAEQCCLSDKKSFQNTLPKDPRNSALIFPSYLLSKLLLKSPENSSRTKQNIKAELEQGAGLRVWSDWPLMSKQSLSVATQVRQPTCPCCQVPDSSRVFLVLAFKLGNTLHTHSMSTVSCSCERRGIWKHTHQQPL